MARPSSRRIWPVDAGEPAAAVFDPPGDHFERQARVPLRMCRPSMAGIDIGADRVDVVQHEILELRARGEQS